MAATNSQFQFSGHSFLHAQFRKWAKRLNLCLNLRPQLGHAWRGSWPHSTRMWRRNEWYSWYTLPHLGHANKLFFRGTASMANTCWFWCFLVEWGNKTVKSLPDVLSVSAETGKDTVSTMLTIWITSNFQVFAWFIIFFVHQQRCSFMYWTLKYKMHINKDFGSRNSKFQILHEYISEISFP